MANKPVPENDKNANHQPVKSGKSKTPVSGQTAVTDFINRIDPGIRDAVQLLREIILGADPLVSEQIKWNSPAFFYSGPMKPFDPKEYKRDIVVINLHRGRILLVYPTGSTIDDRSGLLQGDFTDGRRTIQFSGTEQIKKHMGDLQGVIRKWLEIVE